MSFYRRTPAPDAGARGTHSFAPHATAGVVHHNRDFLAFEGRRSL